MTVVITAKLSLAVRLIDTTTGRELTENDVRFLKDGRFIHPIRKGNGLYVFVNSSREDFPMQIDAHGYDPCDIEVDFDALDPRLPMADIFLMPSEKNRVGGSVLSISGTLSKLEYIEAVRLDSPIALFHSMQEKKGVCTMNLLPVRSGGGCIMDTMKYALLSETGERYDVFEVKQQSAPLSIIFKDPIPVEHKLNDKILRIVYGRAGPKGAFVLKVRDDATSLPYLLHFKAGKFEYFRKIDFATEKGEIDLKKDAIKQMPLTGKEEKKDE